MIVTIRDNGDYIGVLSYSYYTHYYRVGVLLRHRDYAEMSWMMGAHMRQMMQP